MAPLIALAEIILFAAGVVAGIVGVVSVAIRREEKNLTLTSGATDPVTRAGRWVNGVGVRAPRRSGTGRPGRRPAPPPAAVASRHGTIAAGAAATPSVHVPGRT